MVQLVMIRLPALVCVENGKENGLEAELESRQQHMSAIFFLSHSFLGKVLPKKEWKLVSIISERQDTV